MKIAIYSRKSKQTETGDSIQNQITMCKDYANTHFDNCEFTVYEDEGFSGGNAERPMFKNLSNDIKTKKIDVLICYRLDRISRNVADFSQMLELLNLNNIGFISIKEQFDTTTPMGKAMMYIASVFAQLERDTIAERITDNLSQLAKSGTGRYLNGTAPEGYKKVQKINENGKTYTVLEQIPEESEKISLIYGKYLELQSINKVETYLFQNDIKTRNNCKFNTDGLNRILRHPIYGVADENTYNYFHELGVQMSNKKDDFNGTYGITVFKRSGQGKGKIHQLNEPSRWIVGVGAHKGIISSRDWLDVQRILNERSNLQIKKVHSYNGLLNGLLRCSICGGYMRPFSILSNRFYYICSTKEVSRKQKCNMKNIRGDILDKEIIDMVRDEFSSIVNITKIIESSKASFTAKTKNDSTKKEQIQKKMRLNDDAISNLIKKLAHDKNDIIEDYIKNEIQSLDRKNKELKIELDTLLDKTSDANLQITNLQIQKSTINKIRQQSFEEIDMITKRNLLKSIIYSIEWDGVNITINFHR